MRLKKNTGSANRAKSKEKKDDELPHSIEVSVCDLVVKEELIDANEIEKKKYYPETDDINGDLNYEWEDLGYTNGWETSYTIC